jgi:hypothetical protein
MSSMAHGAIHGRGCLGGAALGGCRGAVGLDRVGGLEQDQEVGGARKVLLVEQSWLLWLSLFFRFCLLLSVLFLFYSLCLSSLLSSSSTVSTFCSLSAVLVSLCLFRYQDSRRPGPARSNRPHSKGQ